jgi:hypothetical protein
MDNKIESLVGGVFSVMDIRVIHSYKKPNTTNRCERSQCSHLCLPSGPQTYSCACPPKMALTKDKLECKSKIRSTTSPSHDDSKTNTASTSSSTDSTITSSSVQSIMSSSITTDQTEILIKKIIQSSDHTVNNKHESNINTSETKLIESNSQSDGKQALFITLILLIISLIIGTFTLFIYRKYRRFVFIIIKVRK